MAADRRVCSPPPAAPAQCLPTLLPALPNSPLTMRLIVPPRPGPRWPLWKKASKDAKLVREADTIARRAEKRREKIARFESENQPATAGMAERVAGQVATTPPALVQRFGSLAWTLSTTMVKVHHFIPPLFGDATQLQKLMVWADFTFAPGLEAILQRRHQHEQQQKQDRRLHQAQEYIHLGLYQQDLGG